MIIQPNESGSVDLKPHCAGFYGQNGNTVTPSFSIEGGDANDTLTPSVNDNVLTVKSNTDRQGIYQLKITVNDGETTFTQRFGVAVTADASTAIQPVWSEENMQVVKREFFTLDGKKASSLKSHEVYVMKVTDAKGKSHSVKIIKN